MSSKKILLVDVILLLSPDSPVIEPKFVKGSKRYGRRSTPEFIEPFSDSPEVDSANPAEEQEEEEEDTENNDDSAVPRKREVRRAVHWCEPSNHVRSIFVTSVFVISSVLHASVAAWQPAGYSQLISLASCSQHGRASRPADPPGQNTDAKCSVDGTRLLLHNNAILS